MSESFSVLRLQERVEESASLRSFVTYLEALNVCVRESECVLIERERERERAVSRIEKVRQR